MIAGIIALIVWTIVGLYVAKSLYEDGYIDENTSPSTMFIVSVLCGPMLIVAYLVGLIISLVRFIIFILESFRN